MCKTSYSVMYLQYRDKEEKQGIRYTLKQSKVDMTLCILPRQPDLEDMPHQLIHFKCELLIFFCIGFILGCSVYRDTSRTTGGTQTVSSSAAHPPSTNKQLTSTQGGMEMQRPSTRTIRRHGNGKKTSIFLRTCITY